MKILRIFKKKSVQTILMWEHQGWGNSIGWMNWSKRKVFGHMTPCPSKGDILQCKMESGKIASFRFKNVEVMRDPSDQFFATVEDMNYVEKP